MTADVWSCADLAWVSFSWIVLSFRNFHAVYIYLIQKNKYLLTTRFSHILGFWFSNSNCNSTFAVPAPKNVTICPKSPFPSDGRSNAYFFVWLTNKLRIKGMINQTRITFFEQAKESQTSGITSYSPDDRISLKNVWFIFDRTTRRYQ